MRPVKLKELPKGWQAEARRQAGMRPIKHRESVPQTTRASIPASWTNHISSCGWAGMGNCPYCDEFIGPCLYCTEEGAGDVQGAGSINPG